ncbi:MAG TPA: hypothetical protein VHC39_12105 [Rhizomicrobium sp.]|nr:hypothetical protein [Rhizomicrobium sp.]
MLKTTSATIALFALSVSLADPAMAAGCASPAEAAALKTAVMQQELMVAALQCHESGAYNRFVVAYRPELQDSDAALKAFFVRRGGEHGEAGYDAFKTKAANLSALEQARDAHAFCADAHALFEAALANRGSLMSFVDSRSGSGIGNICVESRPAPLPVRTADARAVTVAPVPATAAAVKIPAAPARTTAVKVADVRPADTAVGGVPSFNEPAIPYRNADAPPPVDRDAQDQDDEDQVQPAYATGQEEAPPPPQPRYYQIRNRSYSYDDYGNYAPPPPRAYSYGPPQGWSNYNSYPAPQPGYGWYPQRSGYYNW